MAVINHGNKGKSLAATGNAQQVLMNFPAILKAAVDIKSFRHSCYNWSNGLNTPLPPLLRTWV
jgi:hypothetical protein